jgi:predicted AAA+ superfamily ATPase
MNLSDILQDQNPWWTDGAIRRARGYPVRRDLQPDILSRLLRLDDRRAMILIGPRQVGKTVLLLQLADDLLDKGWPAQNLTYFDFADDRLTTKPTAREVAELLPVGFAPEHPRILLLDEIRSAPSWDLWLKQAVDHRLGRIVATDSAAGLLRDGARESGVGRWDEYLLQALSFREFARLRSIPGESLEETLRREPNLPDRYLSVGGFPEHVGNNDYPELRRRLRSDIAERAILHDLSKLGVDTQRVKDLFAYFIQNSGAELNVDARGNDLKADSRTVRDWVRLLIETQLLTPLDRYLQHAAPALRSRPKIYACDPGLVTAFAFSPVEDPGVRAKAFEAAVLRHLREALRQTEGAVTYFRHKDDLEIDFVLRVGDNLIGIEVKSGLRVRPEALERLRQAGEMLRASRLVLIYGGVTQASVGNIQIVPLLKVLMDPEAFLEDETS